jgi:hypothetical protein
MYAVAQANPYERGRRDGERGLERAANADRVAHAEWLKHRVFHDHDDMPECGLECAGLVEIPEETRKVRRQQPDGLPRSRHVCPDCGGAFRTESLAQERIAYDAGYEAGLAQYARDRQRRRNDQARRSRRARRR